MIKDENLTGDITETPIESNEHDNSVDPNEYKVIIDMIHEMDEQCELLTSFSEAQVKDLGLNTNILDYILQYEKRQIPSLSREEILSFIRKYCDDVIAYIKFESMTDEELTSTFTHIKDLSISALAARDEANTLKTESSEVLKEYFNYMSSDKLKKAREKRLASLKESVKLEKDEVQKRKMEKMIESMESSLTFDFMKKRLNTFGEKEIKSIMDGFFDGRRGTYIIDKYRAKISKFGYDPEIYSHFLNIEETFLEERYSPFNNLFLYIYVRMVAYSDPYSKTDKLFVQAITGALASLIYHKFESFDNEQFFLSVIRDIDNRFADHHDKFVSDNTTYSEHPVRKEYESTNEKIRREEIIRSLDNLNITGYDKDASTNDLMEFYTNEVNKMQRKQIDEYRAEENNENEESEDSNEDAEEDKTLDTENIEN